MGFVSSSPNKIAKEIEMRTVLSWIAGLRDLFFLALKGAFGLALLSAWGWLFLGDPLGFLDGLRLKPGCPPVPISMATPECKPDGGFWSGVVFMLWMNVSALIVGGPVFYCMDKFKLWRFLGDKT